MAVVMIMELDGVTPEQYEEARKVVNWEGDVPPGGLYHVAAFDGKKLHVTYTWENADDFQKFAQERLMPGVQKIGIKGEPEVEIYPAPVIFAPGYTPRR